MRILGTPFCWNNEHELFFRLTSFVPALVLVFLANGQVFSQCNITVDAGPDQFACTIPETFQLQGTVSSPNTILSTEWTPYAGLSDPFSLSPTATISVPTTYTLSATTIDFNNNLVVNGDFSGGNAGFFSDYTYNASPSIPGNQLLEGYYTIATDPAPLHVNWVNCGDHTTGTGNMMIVNGHETPGQNVWCQTITVDPNADYAFSAWVTSVDPNGPCLIQFNINGIPLGAGNVALSTTCQWQNFFEIWNAGANNTATICIEDLNTQTPGNDFAIDDIVFAPTCEITDEVSLTPSTVLGSLTSNGPLFCEGETLELDASGGFMYEWVGPGGFTASGESVQITDLTIQNEGTYTVIVTNAAGCTDEQSTSITILPDDLVYVSNTTCDPLEVGVFTQNYTNQVGCDSMVINTVSLSPSNSTNLSATTCDSSAVGVFTELLTNQYGCDSTVITTVSLNPSEVIILSASTCDPANAGVFTQNLTNQYGCDSTVITTVSLNPSDVIMLSASTCDPASTGVFTQNLTNQYGCDSTVTTTVTLDASSVVNLSASSCDTSAIGVFTEVYSNQFGCDSTVITTVTFEEAIQVDLFTNTCDSSGAGVFTEYLTSQAGCDSIVTTTVVLNESHAFSFSSTTCDPLSAGIFTEVFTNQYGCDSIITTTVNLLSDQMTNVHLTTCDSSAAGVFTEVFLGQNGCDSTVVSTVSFASEIIVELTETTCDPMTAGVYTQNLISQSGCDSIVITTIYLVQGNVVYLNSSTCDSTEAGVFTEFLTNQYGCDSMVVTTVDLLPHEIVDLNESTCDPTSVGVFVQELTNQFGCDSTVVTTVSLLPQNEVYENSVTCDSSLTGVFTEVYSNQYGCDSTVVTTVSLQPSAECGVAALLEGSTILCGEDAGILTVMATEGIPPFDFVLSGPVNSTGTITAINTPFIINNLSAGNYEIVLTSANGYSVVEVTSIDQFFPPTASINITSTYNGWDISCTDAEDGAITVVASGGTTPYEYSWSNGEMTVDVNSLSAGTYAVIVTDAHGCSDTASVVLEEPAAIDMTLSVNDLDCFSQNSGALYAAATGGVEPYSFLLNGSSTQTSGTFIGLNEGTFEVEVIDANGCSNSDIVAVNLPIPVDVDLGDDLLIELGDDVQLQAIVNVPFDSLVSISWTPFDTLECPTCLTQNVFPLVTSSFSIHVTDVNGCSDEDALNVIVDRTKNVFVPNGFSPNGDGINDLFLVYAEMDVVENIESMQIFSRWGELVFQEFNFDPNDQSYGWNGTYRGEELDPSVFVWMLEISFIDGSKEIFKGDLTLVK